MTRALEFRLLGPLEVSAGGRSVSIGGGKRRSLLALLALHANEVVSTERLIDELWGERPPVTAVKGLQVHISQLRKELAAGGAGELVLTRSNGYALRVEPDGIDIRRFERALEEGQRALSAGESARAAGRLREALAFWRGPPLVDFSYEPFARREIARLEELRLVALEERIEADLALGDHASVVAELDGLVGEHPLRERLRGLLMLALYRSGRRAEALEVYREGRTVMVEELGLEPGPRLRELQAGILSDRKELAPPAVQQPVDSEPSPPQAGAQIVTPPVGQRMSAAAPVPALVSPLVGRGQGLGPVIERLRGRGARLGLAAVVPLLAAAGAGVLGLTRDGRSAGGLVRGTPNSVVVLDPGSDRIVGQVAVPRQPSLTAANGRSVWVASDASRTISRVDGRKLSVTDVVPANVTPSDAVAARNAVWLIDGERDVLVKVDAAYGSVARRRALPTGPGGAGLDVGRGAVWVANGTSRLLKLDPRDAGVVKAFNLRRPLDDVAVGTGAVWAISGASASVLELDPKSGSVRARIPVAGRPGTTRPVPIAVAAGEGSVWVLNANTPSVTRIDSQLGAVTATIPLGVGSNPSAIATGAGAVWVALNGEGSVARIDPNTGAVRFTRVGGAPTGVSVGEGRVWISVQPGFRAGLASRGRTIQVPGAISEPFCSPVEFAKRGKPRLLIVSDFPLQYPVGRVQPLQFGDAIRFVLARHDFRAGRYSVGYQSCDYSIAAPDELHNWTSESCRRNARAFANAPLVVGVIGPFNSGCAAAQLPVLGRSRGGPLAEISASATAVGLTHRGPGTLPGEPETYYPRSVRNFARVVAADDVQGGADALMARRLGVSKLYVLDDQEPYGIAVATGVRRTAMKLGLDIAGSGHWTHRDRSFRRLANRIEGSSADGVFLGGFVAGSEYKLLRDLRAVLGPRVQFLAPDGFSEFEPLIEGAGPAAEGLVVSVPILPADRLPASGRRFVEAFETAIGQRASPWAIATAQATEVLLDAIAASDGTRSSVTKNLLSTRIENGILGNFEFDENGDTTAGGVTMYRIERGKPRVLSVITPHESQR